MTYDLLLGLAAFAFVSSITPGPNNLMLMASGANFGILRTLPHMFGVALGFTLMLILVGLGLAQVFTAFPVTYNVLRVVSVIYLLYLAYKIATAAPRLADPESAGTPMTFLQAAAFQWVNPKAWSMGLTASTVYAPPSEGIWGIFMMAAVFGCVNLPSITIWTSLGVGLRQFLSNTRRLQAFNILMALLLVGSLGLILI